MTKELDLVSSTRDVYEGISIEKFPQALALLLHKIYSSYWGHMKALGILLKWGYGSLDSSKK